MKKGTHVEMVNGVCKNLIAVKARNEQLETTLIGGH